MRSSGFFYIYLPFIKRYVNLLLINLTRLTHLCRVDSPINILDCPFPAEGVSGKALLLPYFIQIPVLNANSIDPDQTPRSAASDLDLHCFQITLLSDARHKWVITVNMIGTEVRHYLQYCTSIQQRKTSLCIRAVCFEPSLFV